MATTQALRAVRPEESDANDAHSGATMLALLVLLWGGVSYFFVPREPFGTPNLLQVIVCGPAFLYFVATRKRPSRHLAARFSVALLAYSLLLLPWTAVQWAALGRPWEALTVPQLASVAMVMLLPRHMAAGIALVLLFGAESLFASAWARHVGMAALVPVTEPYATLAFAALGISLFVSRRQRVALADRHIVVQSEVEALRRVTPLFSALRADLGSQIDVIDAELKQPGDATRTSAATDRALQRLTELRGKLDGLLSDPAIAPCDEAEHRLLDHDAQFGITTLAAIGTATALCGLAVAYAAGTSTRHAFVVSLLLNAAILAYLVMTRQRPSRRRATWTMIALFVLVLPLASYNQVALLRLGRPFMPLFGHKLAMMALGITAASRFGLSLGLILLTAANAFAIYFGFHFDAHKDRIAMAEPWVTVVFMLVALMSLWMREARRIASVRLLRDETEAAALHRRARMFLALRDRLNSPLQLLVVGVARSDSSRPPPRQERVEEAVTRLVALSRDLSRLDALIPEPSHAASLNADQELLRRR